MTQIGATVASSEWALRASTFLVPIDIPDSHTVTGTLRGAVRHGVKLSRLSASGHFGHHVQAASYSQDDGVIIALVTKGHVHVTQFGRTVSLKPGQVALYDAMNDFSVGSTAAFGVALTYIPRSIYSVNENCRESVMVHTLSSHAEGPIRDLVVNLHSRTSVGDRDALLKHMGELRPELEARPRANLVSRDVRTELDEIIARKIGSANLSGDSLAQALGVSRRTLYNHLSDVGGGLAAYVKTCRLRQAAKLLRQTHWSVTTVATECGFENLSHFTRCFKAEYGMTPRQFRTEIPS